MNPDPSENKKADLTALPKLGQWLSMSEAANHTPYSAEYLSLLARKNKIAAKKIDNAWYTTKEVLDSYMQKQMLRAQVQNGSYQGLAEQVKKFPLEPIHTYGGDIKKYAPQVLESEQDEVKEGNIVFPHGLDRVEQALENVLNKKIREQEFTYKREEVKKFQETKDKKQETIYVKRRSHLRTVFSSRYLISSAIVVLILMTVLPVPLVFSFVDRSINYLQESFNDANTVLGFRPGTHENEILLLDKEGNISIMGHIETEGQLKSFVEQGIAPIVVDSTTNVENLSADFIDGFSSEQFTLAFVTKNGNMTTEDVFFNGRVEVGQTLKVKGATKLLSTLEVGGKLKVFGDAEFMQAIDIFGPAYFESLVTMASDLSVKGSANFKDNVTIRKNLEVRGSIESGSAIIGKSGLFGSLSSKGDFSAGGKITLGNISEVLTITSKNITINSNGDANFGGSINADGFSGEALVVTNSTSTNSTSTNLFSTNGTFVNLIAENIDLTNFTFENATGTNLTIEQLLTANNLQFTNSIGTNATITNATSTNFFANILRSTLATITTLIADDITTSALTATNSTTTNSTTTNAYVGQQLTANNLEFTNGIGGNATITNATTTSFFSNLLTAITGRFTSLFSDEAEIVNLNATNSTTTNATTTDLFSSRFNLETGTLGSATSTNFFSSIASSTNLFTTNFNFGTGIIGNATTTNLFSTTASSTNLFSTNFNLGVGTIGIATISGLNFINATGTSATTTNFFSTTANFTNISAEESNIGNLTFGNATGTNATTTSFFTNILRATLATITSLIADDITTGALTATNATTTNLFSTTASSTNLFSTNFNLGTGTVGEITAGTARVTSLTAGRVPYISTAGLLTDSALFLWDNTLSRLTLPHASTTALSVSGNAYFPGSGIWNSSGSVGVGTTTPSVKFSVGGGAGDTTGHGYFTGGLGIGVVNTTAGTLQTTGDVLIGGSITIQGSAVSSATTGQFQFLANPTGTSIDQGTVYINPATAGTNNVLLGLAVGSSERVRIDAEGDIQITGLFNSTNVSGTNTFSGGLSIDGNTTIGNASADTVSINAEIATSLIPNVDNSYNIGTPAKRWSSFYSTNAYFDSISTASSTLETFIINSDNATADTEDSSLQFERGTEIPNAIIRWDSTLNRFDFNDFPVHFQNKIVVSGTASSSIAGQLWVTGSSQGTGIRDSILYINPSSASADYKLFSIGVNDVARFSVDAEGDTLIQASLGIENALSDITQDTLVIDDKLQINGNEIKDSSGTTRLTLGATNTLTGALTVTGTPFILSAPSAVIDFSSASGVKTIQTGGTTDLALMPGGNVGIGTTIPSAKLVIDKNLNSTTLGGALLMRLQGVQGLGTRTEIGFDFSGSPGTYTPVVIGYQNTENFNFKRGSFYIATRDSGSDIAPTERFTITAAGNVGIGVTDPTVLFDVQGGAQFGSGNVNLIDGAGKIAGLSTTYFNTASSNDLSGIITDETGSGALVFATAPTLTTLTVSTGGITVTGNSTILGTLGSLTGLTSSGSITFSSLLSDRALCTTTGGLLTTVCTSQYMANSVTDETGSGALVFATSPQLVTPDIGAATGASLNLGTGTITSGLINGQTISNAANFTGTVAIATSLSVPLITSPAALTLTPAAGSNLNINLSGAGDFAVSTNQLYVDTSTGNVGIGSSAPTAPLTIDRNMATSTLGAAMILRLQAVNGVDTRSEIGFSYVGNSGTYSPVVAGYQNTNNFAYTRGNFYIATRDSGDDIAPTERLTVTAAGNVGIGTTAPLNLLSVYGSDGTSYLRITDAVTLNTATDGMRLGYNAGILRLQNYETGGFDIMNSSGTTVRFTDSGNVGIGTTNPQGKLSLQSSATGNDLKYLTIHDYNGTEVWDLKYSNSTGRLALDSTGSYPLTLNSAGGNVGIGTTDPGAYKLNVNGNTNITGTLTTSGTITSTALTAGRVTFAGSAGVLTDDADMTFATDTLTATKIFAPTSVSTPSLISTSALTITPAAGSNLNVALSTTGDFAVNTNQLYVDTSAGNVGIGTASPLGLLHIQKDQDAVTSLRVRNDNAGTSNYSMLAVNSYGNAWGMRMGSTAANNNKLEFVLDAFGTPAVKMVVDTSGNVGIGVTSPLSKLDVVDSYGVASGAAPQGGILISNLAAIATVLDMGIDNGYSWIQSRDYNSATYRSLALNPIGGNVGIGTTNPGQLLSVVKAQDASTLLYTENTNTGVSAFTGLWGVTDSSNIYSIAHGSGRTVTRYGVTVGGFGEILSQVGNGLLVGTGSNSTPIILGTNSTERMRITSAGNVGIGVTNPGVRLHVVQAAADDAAANGGRFAQSSNNHFIRIGHNGTSGIIGTSYQTAGPYSDLRLQTSDLDRLTIMSSGNVGIGTTNPSTAKLQVTGTSGSNSWGLLVNGDVTSGVYQYALGADSVLSGTTQSNLFYLGGQVKASTSVTDWASIRIDAPALLSGASITNNYAIHQASASQRNYFAGNVGIGITNPGVKLNVQGSNHMVSFVNTDGTTANQYAQVSFVAGAANNYIWTNNQNSAGFYGGSYAFNIYGGSNAPLAFFTNGNATPRMFIDTSGNVGIGSASPGTKLDVAGEIRMTNTSWLYGFNTAGSSQPLIRSRGMGYSPTSYPGVQVGQTGDHIAMFIDPGSITGGSFNGGTNEIFVPNLIKFVQANAGSTDWIYNSGVGTLTLDNGNVTMPGTVNTGAIVASGSITAGGSGTFTGNAGITYGTLAMTTAKNGYYGINFGGNDSLPTYMFDGSGNGGRYHVSEGLWVDYFTNSTNHLNIMTSSDLGYTLGVNGSIGSTGALYAGGNIYSPRVVNSGAVSTDNTYGMYFGSDVSSAYAIYREAGAWSGTFPDLNIAFHTGIKLGANSGYGGMRFYNDYTMASLVMSVNDGVTGNGAGNVYMSGNLSVGTTNSTAKIHVVGNDNQIRIDTASEGAAGLFFAQAGVNQWEVYDYQDRLRFYNYNTGTASMVIQSSDGNVGIGTTAPYAKLDTTLGGTPAVSYPMPMLYSNNAWPQFPRVIQNVSATITTGDTTVATGPVIGLNLENNSATDGTYSPMITFSRKSASTAYNTTYASIAGYAVGNGADANWINGDLVFGTTNSVGPVERMRIKGSGNVGIGLTNPSEKLEVSGIGRFNSGASFSAINTGFASSHGYSTGNWGIRLGGSGSAGIIQAAQDSTAYAVLVNPYGGNVQLGTSLTVTSAGALSGATTIYGSGALQAYSIQGNANVAGTGNASYHPSGIYSTGTNWLYGTMYLNNNQILDAGTYNGQTISSAASFTGTVQASSWIDAVGGFVNRDPTNNTTNGGLYHPWTGTALQAYIGAAFIGTFQINVSDERIKKNIETLDEARGLSAIRQLNPVTFNWLNPKDTTRLEYGLLAQEVKEVFPELVWQSDIKWGDVTDGVWKLEYNGLFAPIIKSIQELDVRTAGIISDTTTSSIFVDTTGNVGIGGTTTPAHKLQVQGDVAATGFINTSTRAAKKDVTRLTAEEEETILEKISNLFVSKYHYNSEDANDPMRMGLIAEEAPEEILSPDGKGIDIYKYVTFLTSGVKALITKVDVLVARVEALESALLGTEMAVNESGVMEETTSTAPSFFESFFDQTITRLASMGVTITGSFTRVNNLFADTMHIENELCVEDVCISKDNLKAMFLQYGGVSVNAATNGQASTSTATTTPEVTETNGGNGTEGGVTGGETTGGESTGGEAGATTTPEVVTEEPAPDSTSSPQAETTPEPEIAPTETATTEPAPEPAV